MKINTPFELVNVIAREHDRTSCSDNDLQNSPYVNNENGKVYSHRCKRCLLLALIEDETLSDDLPKDYFDSHML